MIYDITLMELEEKFGNWVKEDIENGKSGKALMSDKLYPYDHLFSPIRVNSVVLKNRVVMGPMGNLMMCEETGRPNDKMLQYFFERAKGGTGLLTTGLIPVSHGIDPTVSESKGRTMFPRIDGSRTVFSGWRDLAQGVHVYGSKIFVQLTPGLGRVGPPSCVPEKRGFPKSSSLNPNFYIPEIPCLKLTDFNLRKIVKNCGQAAADAQEMGLDGVYLHGHEGYLLEQMTNSAFNRRILGRYRDPERFGIDIVKEIRKRTGGKYPIMYRIDLSLALNETYRDRMNTVPSLKKFKKGRIIRETLEYMKHLVEAGVDMFDVDIGCYDNWWLPHPPAGMPAGCFLDISKIAKNYFRSEHILSNAGLEVPVVAVGKLGYPDLAEQALRDGDCDMVMLARPLLADPDWCNKAYAGDVENIRPCIGCQEGCVNEFILGGHPQCAVNPRTGFEDVIPKELPIVENPKKIAVVGAGPAGIAFAITASKRGHKVTLFEKEDYFGGKVNPGSVPEIKFDFKNYLDYLEYQLNTTSTDYDLKIKYDTEADIGHLKKDEYDSIVFACGAKEIVPAFDGINSIPHVTATELLSNPELMKDYQNITVIGGGVVGCETASWLKYEHNRDVTIIEMLPYLMEGVCTANRGHLIHYLDKAGVKLMNMTKVVSFGEGTVNVLQNISENVPDPRNTWQPLLPKNMPNPLAKKPGKTEEQRSIKTDLAVIAMGGRPSDQLYFEALKANAAPDIRNIGDGDQQGRVLEAVRAGYRLGREI